MTRPPDVLYCIEHVARELNIASAIRHIAREAYGLNVHIHVLSSPLDPNMPVPGLITVPYCGSRRFVPRTVLKGFPSSPVLSLACEQLLSRGNRRYRLPKDDLARQQVMYAAAGDFYRDWLLQAGVTPANIELVGSLPFQLYKAPYRRFFESRRESLAHQHGLDPNLPWVLFPENFGAAFFTLSAVRKRLRGGYRARELFAYVKYARRSLEQIARWCRSAAEERRVELIVRPRPATFQGVFTERFLEAAGCGPRERLHFIKDGPIQEWILASQLVVSSYSTTLLESAVAGTPAYLLAPIPIPESAASEWHSSAPMIRTKDAFLDLLSVPHQPATNQRLRDWAVRNLLSHGDAIDNVACMMAKICAGGRAVPARSGPPWHVILADSLRDGGNRLERCLRQRLRPGRRRVFGHECDDIERREIDGRSRAWSELLENHRGSDAA